MKNSSSAFISPVGQMSKMSVEQKHHFKTARKTIDDWRNIFSLINNSQDMSNASIISETNRKLNVLAQKFPLKTPSKVKTEIKSEGDEEDTFYEAEDEHKFKMPENDGDEWSSLPESFRSFLASLYQPWRRSTHILLAWLATCEGLKKCIDWWGRTWKRWTST